MNMTQTYKHQRKHKAQRGLPILTPPSDPKHLTQRNFVESIYAKQSDVIDQMMQTQQTASVEDKQSSLENLTLQAKVSHARRAAEEHSIIFEEDLDSEGELERSTYYRPEVKNFILAEEQIGMSKDQDTETDVDNRF